MRILVISNLYPPVVRGGYEVECSGVVERLRQRHDVTILTSSLEHPIEQEGIVRELRFLEPNWKGTLRAPLASIAAAKATRRLMAESDPDLVFVWNAASIPQAALCVVADSGVPTAYRVCEHWFGDLFETDQYLRYLRSDGRGLERFWGIAARLLNRSSSLRLDPSKRTPAAVSWNSETIRRLAGVPDEVEIRFERVIHSTSINGPTFEAIQRTPSTEPSLLFLGRLSEEKGARVAVQAVGLLRRMHGISARLTLTGRATPEDIASISREIEAANVGDLVDLTGPLPPDQVAELLARTHALVIPSTWEEPFPLVCIEGALARVPIVASNIGGIPECLADQEHALLFPAGDSGACAEALRATLTDTDSAESRVVRAYARAQTFGWEPYLDASEQFVDDAYAALTS